MKLGPRFIFVRGLREAYNPEGKHKNAVYFANDTREILMNGVCYGSAGDGLVEDVFVKDGILTVKFTGEDSKDYNFDLNKLLLYATAMSDEVVVPVSVGDIKEGTKAETLKTKSISEVLDDIVFPDLQPNVIEPKVSVAFVGGTYKNGVIMQVGKQAPIFPDNFITSFSKGSVKPIGKPAYDLVGDLIGGTVYCNSDSVLPEEIELGEMKYTYVGEYEAGTSPVVSSRGNILAPPCPGGSVESEPIYIYGTKVFYSNGVAASTTEPELSFPSLMNGVAHYTLPLMKWDTKVFAVAFGSEAANNCRMILKFPAEKKIEKVEFMNPLSGRWVEFKEDEWKVTTETPTDPEAEPEWKIFTTTEQTPLKGALQVRFTIADV